VTPIAREFVDATAHAERRLQRLAQHLHRLGERAVYEFVAELVAAYGPEIAERLAQYQRLDPSVLRALGGDRLLSPPLRCVA
jgi:hypothetical protein